MEKTSSSSSKKNRRLIASIDADAPERTIQISDILLHFQINYEKLLKLEFEKSKAILVLDNEKVTQICKEQEEYTSELENLEAEKDELIGSWGYSNMSLSEIVEKLQLSEKDEADLYQKRFYLNTLITDLDGRSRTNRIMLNDIDKAFRLSVSGITGESTLTYDKRGNKDKVVNRQLVNLTA